MDAVQLRAPRDERRAVLAGTLHRPEGEARATVLDGSRAGPSDRDNDVDFLAIRAGLLERGIAAALFDKRGVGESSGDWPDTGRAKQAADSAAKLRPPPGNSRSRSGTTGSSATARAAGRRSRSPRRAGRRVRDHELGPRCHDGPAGMLRDRSPHDSGRSSRRGSGRRPREQDALMRLPAPEQTPKRSGRRGDDDHGPGDDAEIEPSAEASTTIPARISKDHVSTLAIFGEDALVTRGTEHRRFPCGARRPPRRAGHRDVCRSRPPAAEREPPTLHPGNDELLVTGSSVMSPDERETLRPCRQPGSQRQSWQRDARRSWSTSGATRSRATCSSTRATSSTSRASASSRPSGRSRSSQMSPGRWPSSSPSSRSSGCAPRRSSSGSSPTRSTRAPSIRW